MTRGAGTPSGTVVAADVDPRGIVARLMAAVPPGSYLVLSHPAADIRLRRWPRDLRC